MRCSGSRRRTPRSIWSRSADADWASGTEGWWISGISTSMLRRLAVRSSCVAGVQEEPVEPGVEAVGVAQGGQVPPASDERLLDGVLGAVGVPEDESGGGVEPADRGACKHGEGVMIALPRSLHEVPLHVRPRLRAAGLVASGAYGGIDGRIVPLCMLAAAPVVPTPRTSLLRKEGY